MVDELIKLREEVDQVDDKLIEVLRERFKIVEEIGKCKSKNSLQIHDEKREQEIIEKIYKKSGFSKEFTGKLFSLLFSEAKNVQRDVK